MIELEDLLSNKEFLNKEFIFKYVTAEEIFCRFFPLNQINFHKLYVNPIRDDDDDEGCSFYYHKSSGNLYFRDWAWKHFDCFSFVQGIYKVNYNKALLIIAMEFNLISRDNTNYIAPQRSQREHLNKELKIQRKKFTKQEIEFWQKYDNTITNEDLEKSNIISLKTAWVNDKIIYDWKKGDVTFAYHLANGFHYQLYKPSGFYDNPKLKFFSSGNDYILGWDQIDWNAEYIIIGKSYKCWWLAKRFGLNIIAVLTESVILSDEIMFELRDFLQLTLFDNDKKGKVASILYKKQHGTIPLLFPKEEEKDFSDNLKVYGRNYMIDYIEDIKQKFNIL